MECKFDMKKAKEELTWLEAKNLLVDMREKGEISAKHFSQLWRDMLSLPSEFKKGIE